MIRLLPARAPMARGRQLLTGPPSGFLTIVTVAVAVGIVAFAPALAASLDEPDAAAPVPGRPPSMDAPAVARPGTTPGPRIEEAPAATPAPSVPATPTAPVAVLADARSTRARGSTAATERVGHAARAPSAAATAEPTPTPRPTSVPGTGQPLRLASAGPAPAVLPGELGDLGATTVGFSVRWDGGLPAGRLAVHSESVEIAGVSVGALAMVGATASWSGAARWNGAAGYLYAATATDGASVGSTAPDRFAISIQDPEGRVVWAADWPMVRGDIVVGRTAAYVRAAEPDR